MTETEKWGWGNGGIQGTRKQNPVLVFWQISLLGLVLAILGIRDSTVTGYPRSCCRQAAFQASLMLCDSGQLTYSASIAPFICESNTLIHHRRKLGLVLRTSPCGQVGKTDWNREQFV